MNKPIEVTVGTKNSSAKNIEHQFYLVAGRERYQALSSIIGLNPDIFGCVFCRTKIETQKVAEKLIQDGFKAGAIHGDLSQNQRDIVMNSFRKKRIQLLVATDVAARGIDVENISHIINYQLPDEIETYTHRSGRTGRAGKQGVSIMLLTRSDRRKIKLFENKLQTKIKEMELPSAEMLIKVQMTNWINNLKSTPINADIKLHLPEIMSDLESYSKEDLMELVLSKQIKKVAPPTRQYNENSSEQFDRGDRHRRSDGEKNPTDRFFINIGSRDNYEWGTLKDFLRSYLDLDRDAIFKVEVMKNFSFFSAEKIHRELILDKFKELVLDNRNVNVELTKRGKTFAPKKRFKKNKL